jgi:hypothetical protein
MKRQTQVRDLILSLRIVDRYKWNRAKTILAGVFAFIAMLCVGGLEGFEPMPSGMGAVVFLGLAFYTMAHVDLNWGRESESCETCEGWCVCDCD